MKLETIRKIVEEVSGEQLGTRSRVRNLINARAIYYNLSREFTNRSLMSIGKSVGVNHATVLHSLKHLKDWQETDREFKVLQQRVKLAVKSIIDKEDGEVMSYEKLLTKYNEINKLNKELQETNDQLVKDNNKLKDVIERNVVC